MRWIALLVVLALAGCADLEPAAGDRIEGRITDVVDGDTIKVHSGVRRYTVRLIGIDTPEVFSGVECYGRRAAAFVRRVLPLRSEVRYRLGAEERDRYGRALAYVWLDDGRFLNRLLLARGYAQTLTIPPNVEYVDDFAAAARGARGRGLGLWAADACV